MKNKILNSSFVSNVTSNVTNVGPQYSFIFNFEKEFKVEDKRNWMMQNWIHSCYWSILYVIVIFSGKYIMQNRQPFKLRSVLTFWNICLAVFSITGSIRFLPEVFYVLKNYGFHYSVCNSSFIEKNLITGFWTWMFCLSKVPELGDTIFIVLRKQKLIFLHWYHHITVLIFTWYSYEEHIAPGRWYIGMNYFVHSLMYSYYAIRAFGYRVPKLSAMAITILQILQMIVGFYVTFYSYLNHNNCQMPVEISKLGLLMYGSYFILFSNFFIKIYFLNGSSKDKKHVKQN